VAGAAVAPAIAVEAVLVAISAYAIWSRRQKGSAADSAAGPAS
jgi:hypothetical protein